MASSSSNAARGQQSYGSTYNDAGSFGGHSNPRAAGAATSQQSSADYARTHPGVAYKPHQYGANATAAINRVNSHFPSSGHSQPSYYSPNLDFSDR